MTTLEKHIDETSAGRTVRDVLRSDMQISAGLLTKLKKSGGIRIGGEVVKVSQTVRAGDVLTVTLPEEAGSAAVAPVELPLSVVYEDESLLAVNKPKDMPTHPSAGNYGNTLANACRFYYRDRPFVFRPVNRLDRDTTGLVLVAKDRHAGALMLGDMQAGQFQKTYYALVCGELTPSEGVVNAPIGRAEGSIIRRCVCAGGQRAVTEYRTLAVENGVSLVELHPLTGRTHQIRVHMAHIGHPLLYDYLYGTEIAGETLFLHCGRLAFPHPMTKEPTLLSCTAVFPFFGDLAPYLTE